MQSAHENPGVSVAPRKYRFAPEVAPNTNNRSQALSGRISRPECSWQKGIVGKRPRPAARRCGEQRRRLGIDQRASTRHKGRCGARTSLRSVMICTLSPHYGQRTIPCDTTMNTVTDSPSKPVANIEAAPPTAAATDATASHDDIALIHGRTEDGRGLKILRR